jgi:hypothetical protein
MSTPQSIYTPKVIYDCDGTTSQFAVTFPVDRDNDIFVFLTTVATGVTRRMVRNQDYTIATDSDDNRTVVTRVDEHRDPWPAGVRLTIMRRMQFTQPSGKAGMNARVFSNRIDSLTRMFQQLREKLDRTLHVGLAYPPFFKTSEPYPVLSTDALNVESTAKNSQGLWRVVTDAVSFVSIPSGGDFGIALVQYLLWPVEELDVVSIPEDGELREALLTYDLWPVEELDIVSSIPVDGELREALLTYSNYIIEKLSVVSVPSGGSLASP